MGVCMKRDLLVTLLSHLFVRHRVFPSIVFMIVIWACGCNSSIAADALTRRQTEIMQTALSVDGYITQKLHSEFWSQAPSQIRNDSKSRAAFLKMMEGPTAGAFVFQRETWGSIKESLSAKRVVKTQGYEAAKNAVLSSSSLPEFQEPMRRSIASAESMIRSAAEGKAVQSPRGTFYITPEMVDQVMSGLDASVRRARILMNPEWKAEANEVIYRPAHVSIISVVPFAMEYQNIRTENGRDAKIVLLKSRLDEGNFVGVAFAYYGVAWSDPEGAVVRAAKATLSSVGATPIGVPVAGRWRGKRSATAQGRAQFSEGVVYMSARVVELPEHTGALILTSTSDKSKLDADILLDDLEQSMQLID